MLVSFSPEKMGTGGCIRAFLRMLIRATVLLATTGISIVSTLIFAILVGGRPQFIALVAFNMIAFDRIASCFETMIAGRYIAGASQRFRTSPSESCFTRSHSRITRGGGFDRSRALIGNIRTRLPDSGRRSRACRPQVLSRHFVEGDASP